MEGKKAAISKNEMNYENYLPFAPSIMTNCVMCMERNETKFHI